MPGKQQASRLVVLLQCITYLYVASAYTLASGRPCSDQTGSLSVSELASLGLTLEESTLLAKDACLSADDVRERRLQAHSNSISWMPTNNGIPDGVECEAETW